MNKKGLKLALVALLAVSQAFALSEMRTPWVSGNGPLRYMFEKHDQDGKYDLNLWSAGHTKYANRAFMKHGFKSKEITALIFNQSEFSIGDAAYNKASNPAGEGFNPLVDAKTIAPRVEYNEMGMTLGGEISMPIWQNKGRLGVRGTVPFRNIEMERLDSGLDRVEDPAADFVKTKMVSVTLRRDGSAGDTANIPAQAFRMDMVSNLAVPGGVRALLAPDDVTLFGSSIRTAVPAVSTDNAFAAVTSSVPGQNVPRTHFFQVASAGTSDDATGSYLVGGISAMPDVGAVPAENALNHFRNGTNYGALFGTDSVFSKNKKNMWLVFRRSTASTDTEKFDRGGSEGPGGGMARAINTALAQYTENAFGYLTRNGYSLDSQNRSGMGDIDLDVFYAHNLHEDWNAEVSLGLRLPTGGDSDKFGTPYKAMLGNGGHFELKAAGMLAWQPLSWMNVKADASYSFVLEAKENRMAVFQGSSIKNMAPKAAADVDWSYFKGHVDATFFHPKTRDIRSSLGYELMYKMKDNVSFKSSTARAFDGTTDNKVDNKLAAANTESIAHKVRFETSYQLSQYLEMFCGGSFTVAGQNVMRDRDTHGGVNVRF
jgi:hypothetical protein